MRSNILLIILIVVGMVALLLGLASVGFADPSRAARRETPAKAQNTPGKQEHSPEEAGDFITATPQQATSLGEPPIVEAASDERANNAPIGVDNDLARTSAAAASPEAPPPDGADIVAARCSPCHLVPWLAEMKKPAAEWDQIITRMEELGVRLSETEKVVLRDYLAVSEQP